MNITLDKSLQELRRKKGNTQEDLAGFLSISSQAVSKWERAESLPDIYLLPKIAAYYNVSVDDLLGVGEIRKREEIAEYFAKSKEFLKQGKTKEAVDVLRELYSIFPNEHEVIGRLARSIYYYYTGNRGERDCLREVIALEERILAESKAQLLRDDAIELLCYSFTALGDTEKAAESDAYNTASAASSQRYLPR